MKIIFRANIYPMSQSNEYVLYSRLTWDMTCSQTFHRYRSISTSNNWRSFRRDIIESEAWSSSGCWCSRDKSSFFLQSRTLHDI
jgi:hypothetical protein